ncbi:MAG: non-heme iron oxygenase ferredoxin subunit [Candidatus Aenigmarchaeota archaeon]|nr:non-heme iron oxygenase ferredoxin subunit [Candidatus Aenigmarchaeota archaeon]
MGRLVELCGTDKMGEGEMKPFDIEGVQIMLVKHEGNLFAVDRVCTHADADLSDGFLSGDGVVCPLHLSAFNLADGSPTNPPATKPIKTYNVKIHNNKVFVEV